MFGHKHNLYFFDQERKVRARRERKPVDQLPFSLSYTGVSGALKVEAYLRQQIKAAAENSSPLTPDTNNGDKAADVQNNKTKDVSSLQENEQVVSKTTRRGKLFATLSDYNETEEEDTQRFLFEENKFAAPNLLAHLGRILEILYEKYETQADETMVSARGRTFDNWANLTTSNNRYVDVNTNNFNLRAIGVSIPFHLVEKLKWNFEQLIVNTVYTKRQWQTTGYKQQARSDSDANSPQQDMSELRDEGDLDNENEGKISRVKRDSFSKKSKKTTEEEKMSENVEASHSKRGSFSGALKKGQKTSDESTKKPVINIEAMTENKKENLAIGRLQNSFSDLLLKPSVSVVALTDVLKQESISVGDMKDSEIRIGELPNSVQGFRRESVKSVTIVKTPRTRLEKYKYIPDKSYLTIQLKKKGPVDKDVIKEKDKDEKKSEEPGLEKELSFIKDGTQKDAEVAGHIPANSIQFSLMSKTCEENGWVHHVSPDADLERLTVIEWARARLQEAIKKSSEYNLATHGFQPVIKPYGESKIDTNQVMKLLSKQSEFISMKRFVTFVPEVEETVLKEPKTHVVFKEYEEGAVQKVKKGRQKIKRTVSGTAKIELFLVALPDDTLNLYYPSGKIAVCTARNVVGEGKYTYVYATDDETLLAYFTPTSAYCYDRNGKIFMCTPEKANIYDKGNVLLQHWTWKNCKLNPIITWELNEFLTLKIASRNQMNLHFSARQETYKVNVGITQDLHCIVGHSAGEMMTTGDYLSEIAHQLTVVKNTKVPRTKREERRFRAQQRKLSQQGNPEESQEGRREDLNKIFPERKNLALDLPSDVDLYKMRRSIKTIVYDWMESYRVLAGISSPVKVSDKKAQRKHTMSAKSLPGKMPSAQVTFKRSASPVRTAEHRAPSAPPLPRGERINVMSLDKLVKSVEGHLEYEKKLHDDAEVSPVYLTEMDREKILANQSGPKPPFRCGMTSYENRNSSLKEGCPVALRAELLGDKYPCCRCRKREIPFVSDLAYDKFVKECVPHTQLLVVNIVSSRNPSVTQCTSMLEQLYYEKNRNRSFPCAQARSDSYRIVLYNVDSMIKIQQPLLVKRHNVVPGMFLMYIGGKLLFADHIFNGYGNARKDFLKQIAKTRKDYLQGLFLPSDFRLSPTPCRSGPRAAWGGEIGGISRNALCHSSQLDVKRCFTSPGDSRLPSAVTTVSSEFTIRENGTKSAASFINLGLAIDSPLFTRHFKTESPTLKKRIPAKSRA